MSADILRSSNGLAWAICLEHDVPMCNCGRLSHALKRHFHTPRQQALQAPQAIAATPQNKKPAALPAGLYDYADP